MQVFVKVDSIWYETLDIYSNDLPAWTPVTDEEMLYALEHAEVIDLQYLAMFTDD